MNQGNGKLSPPSRLRKLLQLLTWLPLTQSKGELFIGKHLFRTSSRNCPRRFLAIGLENGHILVYSNTRGNAWDLKISLDSL